MRFIDVDSRRIKKRELIEGIVNNFETTFFPLEKETIVMTDFYTKAGVGSNFGHQQIS